jgi:acetamidase/formamidase/AraC-like DNA-binding protein
MTLGKRGVSAHPRIESGGSAGGGAAPRPCGLQFNTEAYPGGQRGEAWQEALAQFSLKPSNFDREFGFHARARSIISPLGISFAHIASGPQEFIGCVSGVTYGVRLTLLLSGKAFLEGKGGTITMAPGDIAYGSLRASYRILFTSDFQQCLVVVPRALLDARLVPAVGAESGYIGGDSVIGRIFADLLGSVANSIDRLSPEQMRPLEVAVIEFLASIAAGGSSADALRSSTWTQTSILNRLCQQIELRLGEHDLSRASVAQAEGISARYAQRLFENAGETFGHYLRLRRLERCRAELLDPKYGDLSITEICYRAGFNDSAHFSRAFRDQYGQSPRAYRKQEGKTVSGKTQFQVVRGWPTGEDNVIRRLTSSKIHEWSPRPGEVPAPTRRSARIAPLIKPDRSVIGATPHYRLPANNKTVHWGYFSKSLPPVLTVRSGDTVTIETLTHHANDDFERMVKGDASAESVFRWTAREKGVDRRGAGPMDASVCGRGPGEGFGVHLCTGPIAITGAEPGDVVELRILDIQPRPSVNPAYAGRCFGSNAATWWGFQYNDLLTDPKPREVVTIYEVEWQNGHYAKAAYNFRWTPQRDPSRVQHPTIDYPGVHVDHATVVENHNVLKGVKIPLRPHFGVIGLAPKEAEIVDSIPPAYFGGNLDNWRAGEGSVIYLPVSVPGGLLSVGDPHASQGDSELCGTAIECSLTGTFQVVLHKKADLAGKPISDLDYPLLETPKEWVVHGFTHPNYLAEFGASAQSEIYNRSSLDPAIRDAFRKMRRFLMVAKGLSEDEAISLISVAVDFGVTQIVDGNWGVHGLLRKELFDDK